MKKLLLTLALLTAPVFAQTQVNSGGTPVIGVAASAASTSPATATSLGTVQLAPGQSSATLSKVATTGSYNDLSNQPTLGTAATQPSSAFAAASEPIGTAAQTTANAALSTANAAVPTPAITHANGLATQYLLTDGSGCPADSSGNGYNSTSCSGTMTYTQGGISIAPPSQGYGSVNGYFNIPPAAFPTTGSTINLIEECNTHNVGYDTGIASTNWYATWATNLNNIAAYYITSHPGGSQALYSGNNKEVEVVDKGLGPVCQTTYFPPSGAPVTYINGVAPRGYIIDNNFSYSSVQVDPTHGFTVGAQTYVGSYGATETVHLFRTASVTSFTAAQALQDFLWEKSVLDARGLRFTDNSVSKQNSVLIVGGDSKDEGGGNTTNNNFQNGIIAPLMRYGCPGCETWGVAVGGQTAQTMAASTVGQIVSILDQYPTGDKIVYMNGGTNDLSAGTTAANIESYITQVATAVHAHGGKLIWPTITPRYCPTNGTTYGGVTYSGSSYTNCLTGTNLTNLSTVNSWIVSQVTSPTGVLDSIADLANDPLNNPPTPSSTYAASVALGVYGDGLHEVTGTYQYEGKYRGACAIRLLRQPSEPCTIRVTLPWYAVQAAATTQTVPLLQLAWNWKVQSVALVLNGANNTPFSGSGLTSLSVTVGDSANNLTTQYSSTPFSLLSAGRLDNFQTGQFPATYAGVVQAVVTGNVNLSNITTGSVDVLITIKAEN